jgi:hypothetical protein
MAKVVISGWYLWVPAGAHESTVTEGGSMPRMTAKVVLEESILDIRAGHWLCGELMQEAEANGNKKPHGCAVGLAVINAKLARVVIAKSDDWDSGLTAYCPTIQNPSHYFKGGEFPKARLKALEKSLRALALAIPRSERPEVTNNFGEIEQEDLTLSDDEIKDYSIEQLESLIIEYNDSSIDEGRAMDWFKAAYDSIKR